MRFLYSLLGFSGSIRAGSAIAEGINHNE